MLQSTSVMAVLAAFLAAPLVQAGSLGMVPSPQRFEKRIVAANSTMHRFGKRAEKGRATW